LFRVGKMGVEPISRMFRATTPFQDAKLCH